MKFGLITTNLRGGGAEKVFLRIAAALSARGHAVHVILLEHVIDHAVEPGISVHALTAPGVPCRKGYFGKRWVAYQLRKRIRTLAREGDFDILISTLPFADEAAQLARLPRLWHRIANTLSAELQRLPAQKARRRLARYRRLYGRANLIAVSDGVALDLREALGLVDARIECIYNPLDVAAIRNMAMEAIPKLPDAYVIHVGRFAAQKRHDLLLDTWQRLDSNLKLVLLAQPDPRLLAMIDACGLAERVIVAGFQKNPYPWIKHARLLVLCSDHEGMPNVILEAAALGTPVVSTDCPSGPRQILGSACPQCLVAMNDPGALSRAIDGALRDRPPIERIDLSPFSLDAVSKAYERFAQEAE